MSQHDSLRLMESLRTADGIELARVLAQRIVLSPHAGESAG
ncbi:hypothetical protein [Streptomyces sp. I6]|nr:hypothetical protein [Streptomyces sp. I6]